MNPFVSIYWLLKNIILTLELLQIINNNKKKSGQTNPPHESGLWWWLHTIGCPNHNIKTIGPNSWANQDAIF